MKRPTINDLADAAGVSRATVNRILSGGAKVRQPTVDRVIDAAEEIGFYGLGALRSRASARKTTYKLGFLLLQRSRPFYQNIYASLKAANKEFDHFRVELEVEFLDDSTPQIVAAGILSLAERVDAIAVVAPQHPEITTAIETVRENNKPVFGLLSPLSVSNSAIGYVGLDNWKVGRMAAWMTDRWCTNSNKKSIAIFVGNHRFRGQDIKESGYRTFFREHQSELKFLEPVSTYESALVAHDQTIQLFKKFDDIAAIYIAGGGISGVIEALEELELPEKPFVIGHELTDSTRKGLMNGQLDVCITTPLEQLSKTAIETMIHALKNGDDLSSANVRLPFEIYTSENI